MPAKKRASPAKRSVRLPSRSPSRSRSPSSARSAHGGAKGPVPVQFAAWNNYLTWFKQKFAKAIQKHDVIEKEIKQIASPMYKRDADETDAEFLRLLRAKTKAASSPRARHSKSGRSSRAGGEGKETAVHSAAAAEGKSGGASPARRRAAPAAMKPVKSKSAASVAAPKRRAPARFAAAAPPAAGRASSGSAAASHYYTGGGSGRNGRYAGDESMSDDEEESEMSDKSNADY